MLGIQVAIGALNDVVDAPRDALSKPRKPIAAGVVPARVGVLVAGGGATVGLSLSSVSGLATLLVGAACLGLGWLYDLRLSRTAWSWLPLALALPLLPIHAWLGASGDVPGSLVVLVPVGVLGGSGLALANGLVDIERDRSTRRSAIVVRLGARRAWFLQGALLALAAVLAILLAPGGAEGGAAGSIDLVLALLRRWGIVVGCGAIAIGAVVLASTRAGIRERGWELEALGVFSLGIGWIAGTSTIARG